MFLLVQKCVPEIRLFVYNIKLYLYSIYYLYNIGFALESYSHRKEFSCLVFYMKHFHERNLMCVFVCLCVRSLNRYIEVPYSVCFFVIRFIFYLIPWTTFFFFFLSFLSPFFPPSLSPFIYFCEVVSPFLCRYLLSFFTLNTNFSK